MRVLFVSNNFPGDLRTNVNGVFQRMRIFIDALREIAHLDVLFYVPPGVDTSPTAVSALERTLARYWDADLRLSLCPRFTREGALSKWRLYGASALSLFQQPGYVDTSGTRQVQAFEQCLGREPEVIFAHRLAAMCPPLLTRVPLPPTFFDLDDIEHVAYVRGIERQWWWYSRLRSYLCVPALWWGERKAIRLARRTFVCSERDRRYLADRWRLPGVVTVPNAVSTAKLLPVSSDPTLLFLGSYRYHPNVQAAEFLLKQIWPRIHRTIPAARLVIAGVCPERIPGFSTDMPGVEFPGFMDDLEALYRRSRVVCCPILAGGGTRIKIIEAAAYGRPIVATRVAAEGLEMHDGSELLLRDDPNSFAEACLRLLKDSALCERMGCTAYTAMVQCYDRAKIVRLIQKYLRE
jgi:glycosyltransferase involved in cell wall biosynthesis